MTRPLSGSCTSCESADRTGFLDEVTRVIPVHDGVHHSLTQGLNRILVDVLTAPDEQDPE